MSSDLRDTQRQPAEAEGQRQPGLGADELRAEQAGELPNREAMSILDVGGLNVGLPPAGAIDGVLDQDLPVGSLPIDGVPVPPEQLPIDGSPVTGLPVDTLPVEPGDGLPTDPIALPDLPGVTGDAAVEV